jgi:phosphatidylglycerol---prolipoprotein diacylglyceryl transferase
MDIFNILGVFSLIVAISIFTIRETILNNNTILNSLIIGIILIIFGIIGSRIYLCFLYYNYFMRHLKEIPLFWKGGMVYNGGIVGGFIGVCILKLLRNQNISSLQILDSFALSLPAIQIIGRIGCLKVGCCFGKPTNLPWGYIYPLNNNIMICQHLVGVPLHPTQIYDIFAGIICLILLIYIQNKMPKGGIFGLYLMTYSIIRFILEFYRYGIQGIEITLLKNINLVLSHNQIFCLICFLSGFLILKYILKKENYCIVKK